MELTIRWGYLPPEVRGAVRPLLLDYTWLLPGWCRLLGVRWGAGHPDGDSVVAACSAQPEYRFGQLTVHTGFLESNPSQRRLAIIHELLHVPTAPMVIEHRDVVARLFEDGDAPKFEGKLRESWRQAFESTVQDLAYAVAGLPTAVLPARNVIEEEDD